MKSIKKKFRSIPFCAPKLTLAILASALLTVGPPARAEHDSDKDRCEDYGRQRPVVPPILEPPASQQVRFHAFATGVQIYVCTQDATDPTKFSWVFKAPEAMLFKDARLHHAVGLHYAGPTWEHLDGSKVVGKVLQRNPAPDPVNDIPWLLLQAIKNEGEGTFEEVTYIQRVNTDGGVAPTTGADAAHVGQEARVPYTAEYYFYRWDRIVYATGFESPLLVAGSPLAGQDGWIAPPPLSPNAAVISTGRPRLGPQTVRVLGADLVHQDFINQVTGGFYDAIGSYRHPVNYDTGGGAVRVSARVRVDGPRTHTGNHFFSAGLGGGVALLTDGGTAGVGEMAISSDGHVYRYTGNDAVPTFLISAHISLGEWHHLAVVADFTEHTSSFYVDGRSLGTIPFDPNPSDPGVGYTTTLLRASMLTYAAPDTDALKKANYAAHYDNFVIKALPEPEDND